MANETVYDLGIMRFGEDEIPCGSFKVSAKLKAERKTVTNSYDGVGWDKSEREYSWEASDVLPEYMDLIKTRFKEQISDPLGFAISTYNILETGDYDEQDVLIGSVITDWDSEQDGGKKVTVKGESLSLQ